jgi:hypothetical protein
MPEINWMGAPHKSDSHPPIECGSHIEIITRLQEQGAI